MRLLILTQKVDRNDPVLGFFHRWIEEFSKNCESLTTICLEEKEYVLPKNVKILSLGKEIGRSRLNYIFKFYKYIWQERKKYDFVFVHMNPEYVVLGGWFWRIWGKKVYLWYNHRYGNFIAKFASLLVDVIFFTSSFSFFSKNKKAIQAPVGIDTNIFYPSLEEKAAGTILSLGRIAPVKKIEILIEALKILDSKGFNFHLDIVGQVLDRDSGYYYKIKQRSQELVNKNKIHFLGSIINRQTPIYYRKNEVCVNLTDSGSLDKTIFEAMACGCVVVACNKNITEIIPDFWKNYILFKENDAADLAEKLSILIKNRSIIREISAQSPKIVVEYHSIKKLIDKLNIFK